MYHLLYRRKKLTSEQESELCVKCQFCCRFMINVKKMDSRKLEFLSTWGVMFITNGAKIGVIIPHACQHITDEGCKIYKNRTYICEHFKGGDQISIWRPFCLWWEPMPENERAEMLKSWAPAPTRTVSPE